VVIDRPIGQALDLSRSLLFAVVRRAADAQTDGGFDHTITFHTMVHEQINSLFRAFRRDAHPMAVMVGVVGALSAFYHDSTDITESASARSQAIE